MREKARKVYIDPTTGKYYALFVGNNVYSVSVKNNPFPVGEFTLKHKQNSTALIPRLYTANNEELIPSNFKIIDENTISIFFDLEFSGTLKLLFFNT